MGDNELIEEVVSPTESQSVDLSPVIDSLSDLIIKQGEIIDNQKKIIDYFVPTEEELKKLEQEDQKKAKEQEQQEKELLQQEEQEKKELEEYNQEVLTLLREIKDNSTLGNEVASVSSSSNYTLLFVIISCIFFGLMYKAIKVFI